MKKLMLRAGKLFTFAILLFPTFVFSKDIIVSEVPSEKYELHLAGPGKNNVVQGVAIDQESNVLYTLHVTGKPDKGVINRFNYPLEKTAYAGSYQTPSALIGHQGITVDERTQWLWSSAGKAYDSPGRYINGFRFSNNSLDDANFVKVYGDDFRDYGYTMPVLSPSSKFLVVNAFKKGKYYVRVFDTQKIDLYHSDNIDGKQVFEWVIDSGLVRDKYFLQAMASDGKYVYLFGGGDNKLDKRLYIYTISGELVQKIDHFTLGKEDALKSGAEAHWEPEGLVYDQKSRSLLFLFANGDKGARFATLYKVKVNN